MQNRGILFVIYMHFRLAKGEKQGEGNKINRATSHANLISHQNLQNSEDESRWLETLVQYSRYISDWQSVLSSFCKMSYQVYTCGTQAEMRLEQKKHFVHTNQLFFLILNY